MKRKKSEIPDYDKIFSYFQEVSEMDRIFFKNMSF